MKKLTLIIVVSMSIIAFSCSKSDDDTNDPDPTPVENYTIEYSVISTGKVTIDDITYLDKDGTSITISDDTLFVKSFEQPLNNYHGKIYVKGSIEEYGTSTYSLKIYDINNNIVKTKLGETYGAGSNFAWSAEFKNTEN
ncbi:MAG: hypothetical protein HQ521_20905 [Bacteroidetes bacterium]|nr:hypothetical protein [Bacteroidota bacterium]